MEKVSHRGWKGTRLVQTCWMEASEDFDGRFMRGKWRNAMIERMTAPTGQGSPALSMLQCDHGCMIDGLSRTDATLVRIPAVVYRYRT